jgi:hypothetical protein
MTVEYILLVALFVLFIYGSLLHGPFNAFDGGAPNLGARVEHSLMTGDGFNQVGGLPQKWIDPGN